jgi:hypothetical protein
MPHVCHWYCTPPIHAHRLLRSSPNDEAQIRHEYTQLGVDIQAVRPVLEFDLQDWRQYMSLTIHDDGTHVSRTPMSPGAYCPEAVYAYLLFVRWQNDAIA